MSITRVLFIGWLLTPSFLFGQGGENTGSQPNSLKRQIKVTALNPGYEMELPLSPNRILSVHAGIGYGGSFGNLTAFSSSGVQILIAPFVDVQHRLYLSRKKRAEKGENTLNNSGHYLIVRGVVRGRALYSNFGRTSDTDFSVGVGWGFQRYKNRIGWSFSIAPYYYFDGIGNSGFFPFVPEINVGYLLRKKRDPSPDI